MTRLKQIIQIANNNNGVITSSQVTRSGIPREHLSILVKRNLLEHSDRGVYTLPDIFEDEMYTIQLRYKKGIYSHETALFLHGLTDRTPFEYSMTFPLNYNTTIFNSRNITPHRVINEHYLIGLTSVQSPGNNKLIAYNSERTLCDILKGRSNTDIQIISEALNKYVKQDNKNIPLLSEYAKQFRVENKLRPYLEVLI